MNFLEREMNQALEKENAIRKKDGLPPVASNITFIDESKEIREQLADIKRRLKE